LKYVIETTPSAITKTLKYTILTTPSAETKSLKYTIEKAIKIANKLYNKELRKDKNND